MSTEARATGHGSNAAMQPLPMRAVIGYGAGDAANNMAFTTTSMILLVYYTDVLGLAAGVASTVLASVKLLDAFFDLFAGAVVDRARMTRHGKFRPFLIWGSIPLLVLTFLNFHIPKVSESGMLLMAFLAFAGMGLAYSLVNIPFGLLAGAMTQRDGDRAKLSSARVVGATVVSAAISAVVLPLLQPGPGLQGVFTRVMLVAIIIGFVLYLICFFTTKERVERSTQKLSLRQSLRAVGQNKPLLMLMASSVFFLSAYMTLNTVQVYYVRDALDSPGLFPLIAAGQLVLTFVFVLIMPALVTRFGKKHLYMAFTSLIIVGGILVAVNPGSNPIVGLIALWIMLAGVLANNVVVFALEADTVEYGEWKTGVRSEGSIYAVFSFTRKMGQAIGTLIAGWAMTLGGYVSGAAEQTRDALEGIELATGLVPAALALIAVLIMIRYPLTERTHTALMEQIQVRRETGTLPQVDPFEAEKLRQRQERAARGK